MNILYLKANQRKKLLASQTSSGLATGYVWIMAYIRKISTCGQNQGMLISLEHRQSPIKICLKSTKLT